MGFKVQGPPSFRETHPLHPSNLAPLKSSVLEKKQSVHPSRQHVLSTTPSYTPSPDSSKPEPPPDPHIPESAPYSRGLRAGHQLPPVRHLSGFGALLRDGLHTMVLTSVAGGRGARPALLTAPREPRSSASGRGEAWGGAGPGARGRGLASAGRSREPWQVSGGREWRSSGIWTRRASAAWGR